MSKLVTIYGGSGFVGRYVARRMAKLGWRVRVAVRRPNEALFVKQYGTPGQVEPVLCNVRNDLSVASVMEGADAVINCAGTFDRGGKNNFDALAEGAGRIARIAAARGVSRLVHVSAITSTASVYGTAKLEGERQVLAAFPQAVILRPSVIFGPGDSFFNKFGAMAAKSPVLPLPHAETKLQPVYVDDVAQAAVQAVTADVAAGIYELGGPEIVTLRGAIEKILPVIKRRRLIVNMPAALMKPLALGLDTLEALSARLLRNGCITLDQIAMLSEDNVADSAKPGLAELGISASAIDPVLPEYLWPYRPTGQFAAIKASAKNLKKV